MSSIAFPPDDSSSSPSVRSSTTDHGQPTTDTLRAARNRLNAQHSTGPRTPEGKSRSAQNARTHNLTASTPPPTLLADPTYRQAKQELIEELRPTTPMQQVLVSQLAHLTWKLDQIPKLEPHILAATTPTPPSRTRPDHATPHPRPTTPPTPPPPSPPSSPDRPTPLTRLWDHHRRLLTRTQSLLRQLLHLQQHRTHPRRRRRHPRIPNRPRRTRPPPQRRRTRRPRRRLPRRKHHRHTPPKPAKTCHNLPKPATPPRRKTNPPRHPVTPAPPHSPPLRVLCVLCGGAPLPLLRKIATPRNTAQQFQSPAQTNPPRTTAHRPPPPLRFSRAPPPPPRYHPHPDTPHPEVPPCSRILIPLLLLTLLRPPTPRRRRAAAAQR